jgi:antitoxin ParD1/3/4
MDIHLTPELEQLVQKKVETGRYNSASDVVGEANRRKQEIREKIAKALVSQRMGKLVDGEVVFDRLEAELDALEG